MTRIVATLALSVALAAASSAAEKSPGALSVGDPAPAFQGKDQDGGLWKSSDHVGKKTVVVYFYPAAMTPGCTKQACGYRDSQKALSARNAVVVGVSGDEVANLKVFQKAYDLNFPLLSDRDGAIAKAFGVPTRDGASITRTVDGEEKTLTRGVTASRWTFVIDPSGKIASVNTSVNAPRDSADVLSLLGAEK